MTLEETRPTFEREVWTFYQNLKAKGWANPDEGDTTDPAALFWRRDNGRYGVHSIEQAWFGWMLAHTQRSPLQEQGWAHPDH